MKKLLIFLLAAAAFTTAVLLIGGCEKPVDSSAPPSAVIKPEETPDEPNPPDKEPEEEIPKDNEEQPKVYKITFATQTEVVKIIEFTAGSEITEPKVPHRAHYTGEWENYKLSESDMTVYAVYTPIVYSIIFPLDNETLTIKCTIEDTPDIPEVHLIEGYTGVWKYFAVENEVLATPEYTPVEYKVSIYIDGVLFDNITANIENIYSALPEIPKREHYTAEWEDIDFSGEEIAVNAVYTAVNYIIKFFAEGALCCEIPYTIESNEIEEPAVPDKPHYEGKWQSYSPDGGNKEVTAIYTPKIYKVEFICKGKLLDTLYYTIEDTHVDEPKVPHITGYTEDWEEYSLDGGDKTVNAVYTPLLDGTEGLVYTLEDYSYIISNYTGSEASVYIPPYYNDLPVKAISNRAFYESDILTEIIIAEGIEEIREEAFAYSKKLSRVYLPDTLKRLNKLAFFNCSALETLDIPDRITEIGEQAFARSGLRSVSLPEDLITLNAYTFYGCAYLTEIIIPDNTEFIGTYAFAGCAELTTVHVGKSVNTIEVYAFMNCNKISYATFGNYENWTVHTPEHPEIIKDISEQLKESPQAAAHALMAYAPDYMIKEKETA